MCILLFACLHRIHSSLTIVSSIFISYISFENRRTPIPRQKTYMATMPALF